MSMTKWHRAACSRISNAVERLWLRAAAAAQISVIDSANDTPLRRVSGIMSHLVSSAVAKLSEQARQ
jgi:hypothetical protein